MILKIPHPKNYVKILALVFKNHTVITLKNVNIIFNFKFFKKFRFYYKRMNFLLFALAKNKKVFKTRKNILFNPILL